MTANAIEAHGMARVDGERTAIVNGMATKIHEYLSRKSGVSFAELSRDIDGFNGDEPWMAPATNVVMWLSMSPTAISAMMQLVADGKINARPTSALIYAYDGAVPAMPVAKSIRKKYVKPHWFPLAFAGNRKAA